uniref:Uncharacterized protein n=1 Tax=Ditylenchus dipsaci TaxID=166011 RepID=A0A915CQA1_9BILA
MGVPNWIDCLTVRRWINRLVCRKGRIHQPNEGHVRESLEVLTIPQPIGKEQATPLPSMREMMVQGAGFRRLVDWPTHAAKDQEAVNPAYCLNRHTFMATTTNNIIRAREEEQLSRKWSGMSRLD